MNLISLLNKLNMKFYISISAISTISSILSLLNPVYGVNYCQQSHEQSHQYKLNDEIYPIQTLKGMDGQFLIPFLSNINKGSNLVSDICNDLEPDNNLFNQIMKPNCNIEIAYIDKDIIHIKFIRHDILDFLGKMKSKYCNRGEIQCGEIIVGMNLIKLLNQSIEITNKTSDLDSIKLNLDIIDFYDRFENLINILNNIELLTNITLKKHKANNYIEHQKYLMKQRKNTQWYDSWSLSFKNSLGNPVKNVITWSGYTVGEGIGSIFSGFSSNAVSNVYSVGLILIIIIVLKKI